ncbi:MULTISPECIES: hypothetical protein [Streptomyces]|uniref:hypothetical protein n=1 Tax=Streptomyces TaxID=1883 RepID=UPI001F0ADF40|nr:MULTISPECIES: hypothetical protein [Streptomyces]
MRVAYTGADGDRLAAPLRELGPVLADSLREMPYAESRTIHSDPDAPHSYYGDSAVLGELDVERAGELLARTGPDSGDGGGRRTAQPPGRRAGAAGAELGAVPRRAFPGTAVDHG